MNGINILKRVVKTLKILKELVSLTHQLSRKIYKLRYIIFENRRLIISVIIEEIGVSYDTTYAIVTKILETKLLVVKFVKK